MAQLGQRAPLRCLLVAGEGAPLVCDVSGIIGRSMHEFGFEHARSLWDLATNHEQHFAAAEELELHLVHDGLWFYSQERVRRECVAAVRWYDFVENAAQRAASLARPDASLEEGGMKFAEDGGRGYAIRGPLLSLSATGGVMTRQEVVPAGAVNAGGKES